MATSTSTSTALATPSPVTPLPSPSLPADFYDNRQDASAARAAREADIERELAELAELATVAERKSRRRDDEFAELYADRQDLADIEQEVVSLRLRELRAAPKRARPPEPREDGGGTAGPDSALSLLTTASFHGPSLTVREARDALEQQHVHQPGLEAAEDRPRHHTAGDDDDGFVDLDWRRQGQT